MNVNQKNNQNNMQFVLFEQIHHLQFIVYFGVNNYYKNFNKIRVVGTHVEPIASLRTTS